MASSSRDEGNIHSAISNLAALRNRDDVAFAFFTVLSLMIPVLIVRAVWLEQSWVLGVSPICYTLNGMLLGLGIAKNDRDRRTYIWFPLFILAVQMGFDLFMYFLPMLLPQ